MATIFGGFNPSVLSRHVKIHVNFKCWLVSPLLPFVIIENKLLKAAFQVTHEYLPRTAID